MSALLNPWVILGLLVALLGSAGSGYYKGHRDATARCAIDKAAMVAESQARQAAERATADAASALLEDQHEKTKIIYRTITRTVDKLVERPVYRAVCLDDDGVREANAALTGTPATATQPDDALPGAHPAGERDGGGGAAQDR